MARADGRCGTLIGCQRLSSHKQPACVARRPGGFSKVEIKTIHLGNNCYMRKARVEIPRWRLSKAGIIMVAAKYRAAERQDQGRCRSISSRRSKFNQTSVTATISRK